MDLPTAVTYLKCIDKLQSQESLLAIQATSFPNVKKEDRQRIQKNLIKSSKADILDGQEKVLTSSELAEKLARSMLSG